MTPITGGFLIDNDTFTQDLKELVAWLKQCSIKTIAMESTGVYWIPLFQILKTSGSEVKLVNARHVKNVPDRKIDVKDCQWLQRLHSYGLLNGSFLPEDQICVLHSYTRQRDRLIKSSKTHVNRMQKALSEMNIQLHHVISDITGLTGMKIIKVIIAGERDPGKLAHLRDVSPNNQIMSRKVFRTRTKKVVNKASIALRIAALNLRKGNTTISGYYGRMKNKLGIPKAITATAKKLACLFYLLLKYGQDYVERRIEAYERQYKKQLMIILQKQAARLGFGVIQITSTTEVS